jgi:hypothetical protein
MVVHQGDIQASGDSTSGRLFDEDHIGNLRCKPHRLHSIEYHYTRADLIPGEIVEFK